MVLSSFTSHEAWFKSRAINKAHVDWPRGTWFYHHFTFCGAWFYQVVSIRHTWTDLEGRGSIKWYIWCYTMNTVIWPKWTDLLISSIITWVISEWTLTKVNWPLGSVEMINHTKPHFPIIYKCIHICILHTAVCKKAWITKRSPGSLPPCLLCRATLKYVQSDYLVTVMTLAYNYP